MPFEMAFLLAGLLAFGLAALPLDRRSIMLCVLLFVGAIAASLLRVSSQWGVMTFLAGVIVASVLGLALQGVRRILPRRVAVTLAAASLSAGATVYLQFLLLSGA